MTHQPQLENYLSALDKALGNIPVGDRSDIITEIKSHILSAQERNPEQSLQSILNSIGEPENVANRYLLERGLKPGRPAKSPMVKWITIGLLGTLGMFLLTFIILIWKFTPLISVDEKAGSVRLLGGVISINSDDIGKGIHKGIQGNFRFHSGMSSSSFSGKQKLAEKNIQKIEIPFLNGAFEVDYSDKNSEFHWECKTGENLKVLTPIEKNGILKLDLKTTPGAKCEFTIPTGIALKLHGDNGKVELTRPQAPIDLKIVNGKVAISPDPDLKYHYQMNVSLGKIDSFESSNAKDAIPIQVELTNGLIENEES